MTDFIPADDAKACPHCGRDFGPPPVFPIKALLLAARSLVDDSPDLLYILCAQCSLELGEFLEPDLKEDEQWKAMKAELDRGMGSAQN